MNLKNKIILEQYRAAKDEYIELEKIVCDILTEAVKEHDISLFSLGHRIKTEKSLSGKLDLKGDKYASLEDITDILGVRMVCFFNGEVDKLSEIIPDLFVIDKENSVDKRKALDPRMFGYMSIHFICSLNPAKGYPASLCEKRFEIQVRSALQHVWAEIEHDLGYKSEFGVPWGVRHEFSKAASILEVADEQFVNIRQSLKNYTDDIRYRIANDTADNVKIDSISLNEYVKNNKNMRQLLADISEMCGAEISEINVDSYISQLAWLGKTTIGDLSRMTAQNYDLALRLAKYTLGNSELDILASNVGLRFLCRAELLAGNYTEEQAAEFVNLAINNPTISKRQANRLFLLKNDMFPNS